jgi:uncharacterized protein (TIGR00661 family)
LSFRDRVVSVASRQGRGHLTQAIAAAQILSRAGHEVVGVVAGYHPGRPLPPSFLDSFEAPVTVLPSPGFVFRAERGVDLLGTGWHGVRHTFTWWRSLRRLRDAIDAAKPDLVLNFFEPLTGWLQLVRPLDIPVLAAAHQFALLGPDWGLPVERPVAPLWLRAFIRFVGARSWKLALSFAPGESPSAERRRLVVAPPLLRPRVLELVPSAGDYALVDVATHGYGELVRRWHRSHAHVKLHCFYDRPGAPPEEAVGPNLTFHQLDADRFLDFMAGCRAVACTAGFESICEAAFLGKPVLMIPLDNHLEQALNAIDGEAAGVAVGHPHFDLDALSLLPERVDTGWFRGWCLEAEGRLLDMVERLAGHRGFAPRA